MPLPLAVRLAALPRSFIVAIVTPPPALQALRLLLIFALLHYEHLRFYTCAAGSSSHSQAQLSRNAAASVRPLRILIAADPQLIDSHTYPHLGAPIQRIARWASDTYARRAWMGASRGKDAVIWAGDLTDGGRRTMSDIEWTALLQRFRSLFSPSPPAVYVPGNHDLGIGASSLIPVDPRAETRWIDAFGIAKTERGSVWAPAVGSRRYGHRARPEIVVSAGSGTKSMNAVLPIHLGAQDSPSHEIVLLDALALVSLERRGGADPAAMSPREREVWTLVESLGPAADAQRVLVLHVPLFRPAGTSCDLRGVTHSVMRESPRSMAAGGDRANTYQNELSEATSRWVLEKVQPDAVFSGDDHDHCEVLHSVGGRNSSVRIANLPWLAPAQVPELTLKAFSMTEGVRRPGYARLDLLPATASEPSSASYTPCLLPDQIRTWTHDYPCLLIVALAAVALLRFSGLRNCGLRRNAPPLPRSLRSSTAHMQDGWELVDLESADAEESTADKVRRIRFGGRSRVAEAVLPAFTHDALSVLWPVLLWWFLLQQA